MGEEARSVEVLGGEEERRELEERLEVRLGAEGLVEEEGRTLLE